MDIASLSLQIDSSQAKTAASDLDALTASGERTSASMGKVSTAGKSYSDQMNAIMTASRSTKAAQVELNAEQEKFISSLRRQIETASLNKYQLLEFKAAELGVADQAKQMVAQLAVGEAQFKKHSAEAAAGAKALEGFSLSSSVAKRELLVMSRELGRGDFTRFASSASIFANASGLVSLALTPIGGLVIGVTAALGGLAAAYAIGSRESEKFNQSLALTGNFAGQTEGQFNALAKSIAASTNATVGSAREFSQALIATGEIGPEVFSAAAKAAVSYGQATGKTADEVAKDFAKMSRSPAKFAEEVNRSLNFITAAQYQAIKSFEENGRAADAQGIIYDALNERFSKVDQNLGFLGKQLKEHAQFWSKFWDAAFDIGRPETIEDKIANTAKKIASLQALQIDQSAFTTNGKTSPFAVVQPRQGVGNASQVASLQEAQTNNFRTLFRQQENSFADASEKATQKAGIAAQDYIEKALKAAKAGSALNLELAENARQVKAAAAAGTPFSAADAALLDAASRKKFAIPNQNRENQHAQLALDLEDIKKQEAAIVQVYSDAEKILEARRAAGLIDEKQYYEAKQEFINLNSQAQESALQAELKRLEAEKFSGKTATQDRLNNERKIIDVQAQLTKVRQTAVTNAEVFGIKESAAANQIAQAYRNAEDAAQKYLDTITLAQQRDLAGAGAGNQERSRVSGRAQIEDRYTQQRQDLEKTRRDAEFNGTFGVDAQKKYDDELDRIKRFQALALGEYDQYYMLRLEQERNWSLGASEALINYSNETRSVAKLTEGLFTNAFQGMEDALVKFTTTGKLDFKSLANSVVADIDRMIIKAQITGPLAASINEGMGSGSGFGGLIGSFLGSLFGAPSGPGVGITNDAVGSLGSLGLSGGRAIGGPVMPKSLYEVNEKGQPELLNVAGKQYLMMGNQPGNVDANVGQSSGPSVHQTVNFYSTGPVDTRTQNQVAAAAYKGAVRAHARTN